MGEGRARRNVGWHRSPLRILSQATREMVCIWLIAG